MTDGMKSGAGSDPFATDTDDDGESSKESEDPNEDVGGTAGSSPQPNVGTDSSPDQELQPTSTEESVEDLPYIFDRSSVKSERKATQYFLREETQATEKDALRAVEQELGSDVSLIDLREALVRVGAEHLDEVADELREWGYRFREE
ncbi:hypothetical protein [Halopenitus malekzadehii]|uniref:hypothetical protein n=1 Tax=Halopenitus malekzadehii TaxID=1267564 RepID=UPI000AE98FFB|nr:hypothetical protein [Halopenitus malekzadehii]